MAEPIRKQRKYKNRVGETHGLLIVIEFIGIKPGNPKQFLWKCKCRCGTENYITSSSSLSRGIKSCGCLSAKIRKENSTKRTLSKKAAGLNRIYILYRSEAKKRKLDFNLSKEEFENLIFNNCHYCGSTLSNTSMVYRPKLGNFSTQYNGIDRKNNDTGYIKSNCVTCCATCNLAKRTLNYNDFLNHIAKIYNHVII